MPYLNLSFAKKTYIVNAAKFWTITALVLLLLVLDIVWLVVRRKTVNFHIFLTAPPLVAIIAGLIILAIAVLFSWVMIEMDKRLDAKMDGYLKNYENAHKGDDGEVLVHKSLSQWLNPEHYKIFPNYKIPGVKADFDFVVVGQRGVILIEVKNYDTHNIFTYDKAYYQSPEGRLVKLWDIREVVKWRAEKLERYLAEHGLDNIRVRKVVLFVNPKSVEIQGDWQNKYKVYIAQGIPALGDYLSGQQPSRKFTAGYILQICKALNS